MAHDPGVAAILQYFDYRHVALRFQEVNRPFVELAHYLVTTLPQTPELVAGLRKLLEARDCCVRIALVDELVPPSIVEDAS